MWRGHVAREPHRCVQEGFGGLAVKQSLAAIVGTMLFVMSHGVIAQGPYSSSTDAEPAPAAASLVRPVAQSASYGLPAFSRASFGVGISPLGVGMQVSTNLNAHMNVRAIGNVFQYSTSFTASSIPVTADLNLASAGGMLDYYPFHKGFRLSGGVLTMNQNGLKATSFIPGGNSITLNGQDYYSSNADPLHGSGNLTLNRTKPAAVFTTGWGNHVKHSGHLSFPVEVGAAFVGTPQLTMNMSGSACADSAQLYCTNIADPNDPIAQQFQADKQSQINKWNKDLSAVSVYPVMSFGVAYSFQTRRLQTR